MLCHITNDLSNTYKRSHIIRRTWSFVLTLILLFLSLVPATAFAASNYVEVTKDNAPIRDDYYEEGSIVTRVSKGTVLKCNDTKINLYLNKWYKVSYNGYSGWIYSENVKTHNHSYYRIYYEGNTYAVCEDCMTIAVEQATTIPISKADSIALALPTALGSAALDGPLPIADVAALLMLATAYYLETGDISTTTIYEMVNEVSLANFAEKNSTCSSESFYRVERGKKGGLYYVDHQCIDAFRAFVCVRYLGIDVWTASPDAALACASLNGTRYYYERDKNRPDYFYHYHLGTDYYDRDSQNHIFVGYNDYGEGPE